MTEQWSWVIVGTGAATAGAAVQACGYLLRERVRARAMARMARALSVRGGMAEVSDQDGTAWSVRLDAQDPQ
ncbi:hypothetical protein [Streptomyces sp. NPDC001604]|uniref:hypothetical protein n=1 Tax=Streptomyces sp. NPDC001604 TaxID=3364593 RepID=UPI0036CCCDEA